MAPIIGLLNHEEVITALNGLLAESPLSFFSLRSYRCGSVLHDWIGNYWMSYAKPVQRNVEDIPVSGPHHIIYLTFGEQPFQQEINVDGRVYVKISPEKQVVLKPSPSLILNVSLLMANTAAWRNHLSLTCRDEDESDESSDDDDSDDSGDSRRFGGRVLTRPLLYPSVSGSAQAEGQGVTHRITSSGQIDTQERMISSGVNELLQTDILSHNGRDVLMVKPVALKMASELYLDAQHSGLSTLDSHSVNCW